MTQRRGPKLKLQLDPTITTRIKTALAAGNAPAAAAAYAGISIKSYYEWLRRGTANPDGECGEFAVAVFLGTAAAEQRNVKVLQRAASGWVTTQTTTRTTTTEEPLFDADGEPILNDDGTQKMKVIAETITTVVEKPEFDWRAAESWLKRRRRAEWGDSIDIGKLDQETLISLLEEEIGDGSGEEGPDRREEGLDGDTLRDVSE